MGTGSTEGGSFTIRLRLTRRTALKLLPLLAPILFDAAQDYHLRGERIARLERIVAENQLVDSGAMGPPQPLGEKDRTMIRKLLENVARLIP
jgi:hypothetical protein